MGAYNPYLVRPEKDAPAWRPGGDPDCEAGACNAESPARSVKESSLSELFMQDLRVEGGSMRFLHLGDATAKVPASRKPTMYLACSGETAITTDKGFSTLIKPGEIAIVFYGDAHLVGIGPRMVRLSTPASERPARDDFETVRLDDKGPEACVLQCVLDLGYFGSSALSNRAAPDLFALIKEEREERAYTMKPFPFDHGTILEEFKGPGGKAFAFAFVNLHLCHVLKQYSMALRQNEYRDMRNPNQRRIGTILREMRGHPERNWTVESMAAHVGLSRSAFAAAFQEIMGEAPMSFLTRERMERAARLLQVETLSMHDVGRRVGYEIESSFARAFKRHWGVAPRSFARQH